MNKEQSASPPGITIGRRKVLELLDTALAVREIRFARSLALHWLGDFPGDLAVSLALSRITHRVRGAEKAHEQAMRLVEVDPTWIDAQRLVHQYAAEAGLPISDATACLLALGEEVDPGPDLPRWGIYLRKARQALNDERREESELFIQRALLADPPTSLAAVMHLEVTYRNQPASPRVVGSLAEHYLGRYHDNIPCLLYLADSLMAGGDSERAVAILHRVVGLDVSGQVARRLWGDPHPYQALWPETLETTLDFPIPAAVAAAHGWNILPPGEPAPPGPSDADSGISAETGTAAEKEQAIGETTGESAVHGESTGQPPEARAEELAHNLQGEDLEASGSPKSAEPDAREDSEREPETGRVAGNNPIRTLQAELKRLAKRVKRPEILEHDGRYPVYVVFSTRQGLARTYSAQAADWVVEAMGGLAEAIRSRPDWDAVVYLADDAAVAARWGIKPAAAKDPWGLKLALRDLDEALRARGEMIGAVLLVGGPEVVPFHHLPNPIDDDDEDVPSDNPYATRDENFFVPEWPLGRLPGGTGADPAYLLESLYKITARHAAQSQTEPWYRKWYRQYIRPVLTLLWPGERIVRPSFGYTAAAWRKASLSVFRPIGESRSMLASPPTVADHLPWNGLTPARLAYYNLHGLADTSDWFGQRDPGDPYEGPDYPIALRPQDVLNSGRAPQVVYSEACFGGHIIGKRVDEALALKFLQAGTQAVVGSTVTAYGSIASPLIAADLLGHAFWRFLRGGTPAGEALKEAKLYLAQEMDRRQGYLDGEDQKTLISFVLYGDPLAQPETGPGLLAKSPVRRQQPAAQVKTVCDLARTQDHMLGPPAQVREHVKQVVEQYLPGMADAELIYSHEHSQCNGDEHICLHSGLHAKSEDGIGGGRQVVTLSKTIQKDSLSHPMFARLTLDRQYKVVKVAVSR